MQIDEKEKKQTLNERINQIWSTMQGKTYTTAVATIVVVVLMITLAVVPAYISITDEIALNDLKTKYVADLATKQQNLNKLVTQEQDNAVSVALLDVYLQNKINNELLVATFSQLTSDSTLGCRFDNASFSDPAVSKRIKSLNPNVRAIEFSVKFVCKIGSVEQIYKKLINLPVLINIDGISYTNNKTQGGGGGNNHFYDKFAVVYTGEYYNWYGTGTGTTLTSTSTTTEQ